MGLVTGIFKGLRKTRDLLAKFAKRIATAFAVRPINEFKVKLLDCDKIVISECDNIDRGTGENRFRIIEIAAIDAVGYVTYESNPWLHDHFLAINSRGVTYMIPTEWPGAGTVMGFLEKDLPGYNSCIGIANSTHFASMTVWPPSLAGDPFPQMETVFPPMFA